MFFDISSLLLYTIKISTYLPYKIHPKLKFTLETEINNTINYLDITIKRNNQNLQFSIFRKSTTSKLSIHNNSCHPEQHKLTNFRFLLHRLNTIPMSKKNYRIELKNILDIAEHNNFPMYKIHRLNRNIKDKLNTKSITTLRSISEPRKYYKLSYFGNISDQIKNVFKKQDINISFAV